MTTHVGIGIEEKDLKPWLKALREYVAEVRGAVDENGELDWKKIDEWLEDHWRELAQSVVFERGMLGVEGVLNAEQREKLAQQMLLDNPYSAPWMRKHGAELVIDVNRETKLGIRRIVANAINDHLTVDETRYQLRDSVGLLERDVDAARAYEKRLEDDGWDVDDVEKRAAKYRKKLLERRLDNIARTEIINASNEGMDAAWKIARKDGYILPSTKRAWIAAPFKPGGRTCEYCDELGKQDPIGLDEEWISKKYGKTPRPPLHPSCRCSMGLVTTTAEKTMSLSIGDALGREEIRDNLDRVVFGHTTLKDAQQVWGVCQGAVSSGQMCRVRLGPPVEEQPKKMRTYSGTIAKADEEKHLVFGWLSVSADENGTELVDLQGDVLPIEVLEDAVYEFMIDSRAMGDAHQVIGVGQIVESFVVTDEKLRAMGLPLDLLPRGWWVGFHVDSPAVWEQIKNGNYRDFSIAGYAEGDLEDAA